MSKYKWAILGPGTIAHKFAQSLKTCKDAQLFAVSSRSYKRAKAFADEYNIPNAYEGTQAMCSNPDIDIVYVASLNTAHKENVLTCLNAGKNVLCEKPMAMNKADMLEMIECAKKNDVFLMEATWTLFLPAIVKAKKWIKKGKIGEIRNITADFGFRIETKEGRVFDKSIGGGALLDLAPYTIGVPFVIMGKKPTSVTSSMFIGTKGADEVDNVIVNFDDGVTIRSFCSVTSPIPGRLCISGTLGHIVIKDFWHAKAAKLYVGGKLTKTFSEKLPDPGFSFEIKEVMKCIASGKKESDVMSLAKSLAIVEIMDEVRRQGGLKYDFE